MNRVIVFAKTQRTTDVMYLRSALPHLDIENLRERLNSEAALVELDLEGPTRTASVRMLFQLAQVIRERGVEARIHHLIDESESAADPLTQIDLELLDMVLVPMLPQRAA